MKHNLLCIRLRRRAKSPYQVWLFPNHPSLYVPPAVATSPVLACARASLSVRTTPWVVSVLPVLGRLGSATSLLLPSHTSCSQVSCYFTEQQERQRQCKKKTTKSTKKKKKEEKKHLPAPPRFSYLHSQNDRMQCRHTATTTTTPLVKSHTLSAGGWMLSPCSLTRFQ